MFITATHCNTLQHTATHCNTLQHTATHSWVRRLMFIIFDSHSVLDSHSTLILFDSPTDGGKKKRKKTRLQKYLTQSCVSLVRVAQRVHHAVVRNKPADAEAGPRQVQRAQLLVRVDERDAVLAHNQRHQERVARHDWGCQKVLRRRQAQALALQPQPQRGHAGIAHLPPRHRSP